MKHTFLSNQQKKRTLLPIMTIDPAQEVTLVHTCMPADIAQENSQHSLASNQTQDQTILITDKKIADNTKIY